MEYRDIINGLKQINNNVVNFIDIRAIYLLPHVIYRDIDDNYLKSELNQAFKAIIDDSRLLNTSLPFLLIECLEDGNYKRLIAPILITYWDNFLSTLEYFINPNPDMEDHIDPYIISRAEYNAHHIVDISLIQ